MEKYFLWTVEAYMWSTYHAIFEQDFYNKFIWSLAKSKKNNFSGWLSHLKFVKILNYCIRLWILISLNFNCFCIEQLIFFNNFFMESKFFSQCNHICILRKNLREICLLWEDKKYNNIWRRLVYHGHFVADKITIVVYFFDYI